MLAKNGARINARGYLKANTGWEIGFNNARNYIHARSLRRHDNMNPRSPRHLGKSLDRPFNFLTRDDHQIRHFVHNHHDKRQFLHIQRLFLNNWLTSVRVKTRLHFAHKLLATRPRFTDFFVVALNISHRVIIHQTITIFHFFYCPFESHNRFASLGNYGS